MTPRFCPNCETVEHLKHLAGLIVSRLYFWQLFGACRRRTPRARSNRRVASEKARSAVGMPRKVAKNRLIVSRLKSSTPDLPECLYTCLIIAMASSLASKPRDATAACCVATNTIALGCPGGPWYEGGPVFLSSRSMLTASAEGLCRGIKGGVEKKPRRGPACRPAAELPFGVLRRVAKKNCGRCRSSTPTSRTRTSPRRTCFTRARILFFCQLFGARRRRTQRARSNRRVASGKVSVRRVPRGFVSTRVLSVRRRHAPRY